MSETNDNSIAQAAESRREKERKIALFIDGENIPAKFAPLIMEKLQALGDVFIRRVYGNWQRQTLCGWNKQILKYGLNAVQQTAFVPRKNSSDMAITIDAMDALAGKQADTFAIISSDSDFTPLVMRLREENIYVIGMGNSQTVQSFRQACSEFVSFADEPPVAATSTAAAATNAIVASAAASVAPKPAMTATRNVSPPPKPKAPPTRAAARNKKHTPNMPKYTEEHFRRWRENAINCAKSKGLKHPKKKLENLHNAFAKAAEKHATDSGATALSYVGDFLKKENYTYNVQTYGFPSLLAFVMTFKEKYAVVDTNNFKLADGQ